MLYWPVVTALLKRNTDMRPILMVQMYAAVEVGMRVYYNCPLSGDSFEANAFFRKYRGRRGTIVGFRTEYVGPLDRKGRPPGAYYRLGSINVRFEGDDVERSGLNLAHFVLLSPTSTRSEPPPAYQRAGDLPRPILFYPGDIVCKTDDVFSTPRTVTGVRVFEDGILEYTLAETAETRAQRDKTAAEYRSAGHIPFGSSMSASEHCRGHDLTLLTAGNVRWLYTDPAQMHFDSPEEEVLFWAQDGLSAIVYSNNTSIPVWEYNFKQARELVSRGDGDLMVGCVRQRHTVLFDGTGNYIITRRLYPQFEQYRDRVRQLALSLKTSPMGLDSRASTNTARLPRD